MDKWDEIIAYIKKHEIDIVIVDIHGVLISETKDYKELTEKDLAKKIKSLQKNGIHVICLTSRIRNNSKKTTDSLWNFGIYPHEIRFTSGKGKGLFIKHILLEYKGLRAIFIDNDARKINSAVKSQAPLHAIFWYLGDIQK